MPNEDAAGDLNLEVEIPGRWNRRGRVDMELRIPRELKVEVNAANGKVCVLGLRGSVRARSSNGAVRIEDVIGDVEIAHLQRQGLMHRARADTWRPAPATERSNSTIIAAPWMRPPRTAPSTARLEDVGNPGVILSTSNGRIVLDLPEEVDGDVDIRVDNGTDPQLPGARSPLPGAQRAR